MLLTETAAPPALPVARADFAQHLRLAHGFADAGAEDALLDRYLAAATAAVERMTGQALVSRPFRLEVAAYDWDGRLALPVGPVAAIDSFAFEGAGAPVPLDLPDLDPGTTRQRVSRGGGALPAIPAGFRAVLTFTAGYPAAAVPADLDRAVLLLAAQAYAERDGAGPVPPAVHALLSPWRAVRI